MTTWISTACTVASILVVVLSKLKQMGRDSITREDLLNWATQFDKQLDKIMRGLDGLTEQYNNLAQRVAVLEYKEGLR